MSLQKSNSTKKYQSNLQSHSKNKMINSLINKKLSQQKQKLKSRLSTFLKQGQQQQRVLAFNSSQVRKRSTSLKDFSVQMSSIKQSIMFNPLNYKPSSQQAQFIISRQHKSPLISQGQIQEVSSARQKANTWEMKLSQIHKQGTQYLDLQQFSVNQYADTNEKVPSVTRRDQMDQSYEARQFWRKVRGQLDNQLWIPGLPYTQMLVQNLQQANQNIQFPEPQFPALSVVKSSNFSKFGSDFKPIISSSPHFLQPSPHFLQPSPHFLQPSPHFLQPSKNKFTSTKNLQSPKLLSNIQTKKQQLSYDFRKYHKDDYSSLEKWFQRNIMSVHKLHNQKQSALKSQGKMKESAKASNKINQKSLLNNLYAVHIAGFQQIMRLTYVEACHKALIIQKIFWSLIRLFNALITQQHKINFSQYKLFQRQIKQQRVMYEQRCQNLQKMMLRAQSQASTTELIRKKLSMAYVTYSRVNSHLCQQLQFTHKRHSQLSDSYSFLNMKIMKLISYLQMEDKIKIIANQLQTTYYFIVDKNQKLEEIVKVKTTGQQRKRIRKRMFQREIQGKLRRQKGSGQGMSKEMAEKAILDNRLLIEQQQARQNKDLVFQTRVGERIFQVEHQLNKYWLKKQDELKIRNILNEQLMHHNTIDIGTSTQYKFQEVQFGCQFPQREQKSFAEFLAQQMQKQRTVLRKQQKQQDDLNISLRQLYEQSYQKINFLQLKKSQLTLQLQQKNKNILSKDSRINQLLGQLNLKDKQTQIKNLAIQNFVRQMHSLEDKVSSFQNQILTLNKKLGQQLQNSQTLVRINFLEKQKLEKAGYKLKKLQEQLITAESSKSKIQIQILKANQQKQQFQSKFLKLDKNLCAISRNVELFLDYKRYDKDSIIISNLKKDLEKYFSDYFCKDSDVFLTKS